MGNVLSDENREQVLALGRLGWSLRRIEESTGVRRETAGAYLRAAGIRVRRRGGRPRVWPPRPATTTGGAKLLHLSTFLGHVDPASTAVYLTVTRALLDEASRRFETWAGPAIEEAMS